MYTEEQVIASLMRYIKTEILPKLNPVSKVFAGAVIIKNANAIPEVLRKYSETAKNIGFYNSDGTIDADSWLNAIRQSMKDYCGESVEINIPIVGRMRFDSNDVTVLHRYIRNEL